MEELEADCGDGLGAAPASAALLKEPVDRVNLCGVGPRRRRQLDARRRLSVLDPDPEERCWHAEGVVVLEHVDAFERRDEEVEVALLGGAQPELAGDALLSKNGGLFGGSGPCVR